jgi:predicted MFS family arabinose efflux permease
MASVRLADPMLPALGAAFGATAAEAASAVTLFALAYGFAQLLWGPVGDRVGKLRVIGWAAFAAAAAALASAFAPSLGALALARAASGACCAAIIPLALAHLGDSVPYAARQATLARFATGTLTGMIAGQALGGLAAETVGWRTAFALPAVLLAATGAAALRLHRRRTAPGPAPPSAAGIAFGPRAIVRGWSTVLADGWARTVLAIAFVEGALLFGALAFVPTWLHERAGLSLAQAGAAVAAVGIGGLVYAITAPRWIAALGERGLVSAGGTLIAAGLGALAAGVLARGGALGVPPAAAACLVVGLGFYMLHNTLQTLATQLAPGARATAVGLFAVALFLGQASGVALAARIGPALGWEAVAVGAGILLAGLGATTAALLARRRLRRP